MKLCTSHCVSWLCSHLYGINHYH